MNIFERDKLPLVANVEQVGLSPHKLASVETLLGIRRTAPPV